MQRLQHLLLVVAVLFALLGNWRAALIVGAAIPLSFLIALTGMARFGISGNLMSLGAIDFGLIIDGAVVVVENIVRQLGRRQRELGRLLSAGERRETVQEATRQVGSPVFFGVMIIAVVISVIVMVLFVNTICDFVERHPTFKMLALSFLLLVGFALVGEGFHLEIPKGYIYFAMGFSLFVEFMNIRLRKPTSPPVDLRGPDLTPDNGG